MYLEILKYVIFFGSIKVYLIFVGYFVLLYSVKGGFDYFYKGYGL